METIREAVRGCQCAAHLTVVGSIGRSLDGNVAARRPRGLGFGMLPSMRTPKLLLAIVALLVPAPLVLGCGGREGSPPLEVPSTASAEAREQPSPPPPAIEARPVEPAPAFDPPPPITTNVDPTIFQWAHPTDEDASLELVIHLDESVESERMRGLARAQEGRTRPLTDIGWPERFAKGDAWLIFTPDEPSVRAKVRGFWPTLYDDDTVELRVMLGRAPEGLAVRPRDWKDRPLPAVRWDQPLAVDHPSLAEIWKVLREAPQTALVAGLLDQRALTADELHAWAGRFVGGTHLVCIGARNDAAPEKSVAGVVLLALDGRVTPIVSVELTPHVGHHVAMILDLDGDGYEEAIVELAGALGVYEHLLVWREGRPVLEPLVDEDA